MPDTPAAHAEADDPRQRTYSVLSIRGTRVTYAPGEYLHTMAIKVLDYASNPSNALEQELENRSRVLKALRAAVSANRPPGEPLNPELRKLWGLGRAIFGPPSATEQDWMHALLQELHDLPALQQPLAYLVNYVPSKWLLEQEVEVLCRARQMHDRWHPDLPAQDAQGQRAWPDSPEDVYTWARDAKLRGLCLSGGGIRSATFNLGILQGLAAQQKLSRFDYLSSVSGGGYIHGWLAGWLRREAGRRQKHLAKDSLAWRAAAQQALQQVQEQMAPIPGPGDPGEPPRVFASHEIRWLRRFSNYLTPEKGLLTLDTWTAIAIWIRNTFLNQLVLICAMLCLLLLPWVLATVWHPYELELVCKPPHATQVPTRYTLGIKGTLPRELASTAGGAAMPGGASSFALSLLQEPPAAKGRTSDTFKLHYCEALVEELPWLGAATCVANSDKKKPAAQPQARAQAAGSRTPAVLSSAGAAAAPGPSPEPGGAAAVPASSLAMGAGAALSPPQKSGAPPASASRPVVRDKPELLPGSHTLLHTTRVLETASLIVFLLGSLSLCVFLMQEIAFTRKIEIEEQLEADQAARVDDCGRPYGDRPQPRRDFGTSARSAFILAALLLPAIPLCYALCYPGARSTDIFLVGAGLFSLSLAVAMGGSAFHLPGLRHTPQRWLLILLWRLGASLGAALFTTGIFILIAALIRTAAVDQWGAHLMRCSVPAVELCFGVPLLASLPFLTISLLVGLVGPAFFDWLRELLGRLLAWTFLITLAWFLFFAIALLSPGLFLDAARGTGIKVTSIVVWLATTIASVLSGKSPSTSGAPTRARGVAGVFTAELLATIGPYVYILGLLIVLSSLVQLWVDVEGAVLRAGIAFGVCASLTLILGWRLDATELSLFPFYRNRLTRCYLGASNRSRDPNPLTGFDDRDTRGLQLCCLNPDQGYPGPFPIFGATLNLTVGKELAYQERKGASFAFTPLYSGFAVNWTDGTRGTQFNGFAPTEFYASPCGGLNIASAIAISGAAVSPNWGYHTKPATAFLLTMFNARLGCWLPNTRKEPTSSRKKRLGIHDVTSPDGRVLFNELFGMTDDSKDFVYLTDGGHFDNMGLYELVRRRCSRIVICDAEEDQSYTFEGIGSTIRKCRIDFGVEIHLDLSKLRCVAKSRFSAAHVITGTIRYPEAPADALGSVTYIKASLMTYKQAKGAAASDLPDLPGDVQSYYLQHEHFPHDSTLDQWFTESQFESYRRLGQSVIEAIPPLV